MRLWSLHPKYLDVKGLVALWREALLAKRVLEGRTSGYKNHPQLIRFKKTKDPLKSVNQYLSHVYFEAVRRGYNFDKNKVEWRLKSAKLTVTNGQMKYEAEHLIGKLKKRDRLKYRELISKKRFSPHPIFKVKRGGIEEWEKNR